MESISFKVINGIPFLIQEERIQKGEEIPIEGSVVSFTTLPNGNLGIAVTNHQASSSVKRPVSDGHWKIRVSSGKSFAGEGRCQVIKIDGEESPDTITSIDDQSGSSLQKVIDVLEGVDSISFQDPALVAGIAHRLNGLYVSLIKKVIGAMWAKLMHANPKKASVTDLSRLLWPNSENSYKANPSYYIRSMAMFLSGKLNIKFNGQMHGKNGKEVDIASVGQDEIKKELDVFARLADRG